MNKLQVIVTICLISVATPWLQAMKLERAETPEQALEGLYTFDSTGLSPELVREFEAVKMAVNRAIFGEANPDEVMASYEQFVDKIARERPAGPRGRVSELARTADDVASALDKLLNLSVSPELANDRDSVINSLVNAVNEGQQVNALTAYNDFMKKISEPEPSTPSAKEKELRKQLEEEAYVEIRQPKTIQQRRRTEQPVVAAPIPVPAPVREPSAAKIERLEAELARLVDERQKYEDEDQRLMDEINKSKQRAYELAVSAGMASEKTVRSAVRNVTFSELGAHGFMTMNAELVLSELQRGPDKLRLRDLARILESSTDERLQRSAKIFNEDAKRFTSAIAASRPQKFLDEIRDKEAELELAYKERSAII